MTSALPCRRHSSLAARIGVAREDITPPIGIYARNWGAASHDVANAVHRPLTLTTLFIAPVAGALSSNESPMVLIDADLGWWKTPQVFRYVQTRLLSTTALAECGLIFALTHTHAGPPLMEADLSLPGSELIAPWMEQVVAAAERAIAQARRSAEDAILDWHTGRCALAAYRDLPDPQPPGSRLICGFNPQGTADDTLVVGRVSHPSGRLVATLVNYACHPTTLAWDNMAISPDYIGAMRETMEQTTGAPAMFLQGASGELAPREQYVGDTRVADRHGRQLAYAALAALCDMEPPGQALTYERTVESGAPLAVWSRREQAVSRELAARVDTVELPLKDWPSAEALEHERAVCTERALEERLRRKRDIRRAVGDGQSYDLPLWAWRVGDAAIIGCCGEAYSLLQRELRKRFPLQTIVCLNLINGSIGYLPPRELYDQDVYQVWQTPFDRGSLERVIEAMSVTLSQWFASAEEFGTTSQARVDRLDISLRAESP